MSSPHRRRCQALTVDGVARFDLQNLAFLSLDITAVPGRSRVDGCTVISGMKIEDAAELTVTRSLVEGTNLTLCGETALRITGASNVQLVDSTFRGGDGFDEFFEGLAGYGGAAVFVWDTSRVWIAGCDLTGGGGADSNTPLWGFDPGEGGDALLAPAITRRVVERFAEQGFVTEDATQLAELTDREREVLVLVARGLSNAEIAAELYLGEATVKTHVSRTLAKLGVRDRVQAVVWAHEHGVT